MNIRIKSELRIGIALAARTGSCGGGNCNAVDVGGTGGLAPVPSISADSFVAVSLFSCNRGVGAGCGDGGGCPKFRRNNKARSIDNDISDANRFGFNSGVATSFSTKGDKINRRGSAMSVGRVGGSTGAPVSGTVGCGLDDSNFPRLGRATDNFSPGLS